MTQTERLHNYLKLYGRVDPITAWRELGIYRLGARIWDLNQSGVIIRKRNKAIANRWGEKCVVAEYFLDNTGENATMARAEGGIQ